MTETTTITRKAGEHTLLATVSTEFTDMAQSLLGVFEGQAANLRDGYILQFGWGPIFLESEGEALRLTTPDYAGDAENDRTQDLTGAIRIQVSQMWLPSASGVRPQEMHFHKEILIQRGWEEMEDFEASRQPSRHEIFSGWFISDTSERDEPYPHDDILKVPAWQVVQRRPMLAQVLAMPDETLTILLDGEVDRVVLLRGDDSEWLYVKADQED
ncbi:immunity protein Imm33 domain-containing protein [Parenemella sanctibonifatiensis]|uniref:Imm33-like domain-containing protein n=1 Tax=Parenemella sanctibonifatiensis TaxID=2016505 RepID=A0A255EMU0_9ACTN|nr:hypothetical protein [Parenemella sanctibonifatiensis]OYN89433.1 hypothetical protein CGZ91_11100 [Parenemella sanctibonifatiensis]